MTTFITRSTLDAIQISNNLLLKLDQVLANKSFHLIPQEVKSLIIVESHSLGFCAG